MNYRAALLLVWVVSLALFWAPLNDLVRLSLNDNGYTHIVVIPLIIVCLMYRRRKKIFIGERWHPAERDHAARDSMRVMPESLRRRQAEPLPPERRASADPERAQAPEGLHGGVLLL